MLSGPQLGRLRDQIVAMYDRNDFADFLRTRLDRQFHNLVTPERFPYQILEVVDAANRKGWITELISGLRAEHPMNKAVLQLALDLNLGVTMYNSQPAHVLRDSVALQNFVNAIPNLHVTQVLEGISRTKNCVCRIEVPVRNGFMFGTGFLIAPDLVLTNYHVAEALHIDGQIAEHVKIRFDFEVEAGGKVVHPGTEYKLHRDGIRAWSPYDQMDLDGTAGLMAHWPADHLDYAVLKLQEPAGSEPVKSKNGQATAIAPERGWIKIPSETPAIVRGGHLHILQHPNGEPLQLAFGFEKILGVDRSGTRIRYAVNTQPGSSGSLCLNENFEWIGLHNLGDPSWNPAFNQGIAASAIMDDLRLRYKQVFQ